MRVKYNGHNYDTDILFGIKTRWSKWFGNYKWPVTIWIQHADDCCNYWVSADSTEGRTALMNDDTGLVLKRFNSKPERKD
jgi:hypothetical protein